MIGTFKGIVTFIGDYKGGETSNGNKWGFQTIVISFGRIENPKPLKISVKGVLALENAGIKLGDIVEGTGYVESEASHTKPNTWYTDCECSDIKKVENARNAAETPQSSADVQSTTQQVATQQTQNSQETSEGKLPF